MYDYVDLVVKSCIKHLDLTLGILEEEGKVWMKFILNFHKVLDSILQEYGCSKEWNGADLIVKDFRHIVTLIEDVHSQALASLDECLWVPNLPGSQGCVITSLFQLFS